MDLKKNVGEKKVMTIMYRVFDFDRKKNIGWFHDLKTANEFKDNVKFDGNIIIDEMEVSLKGYIVKHRNL